jgi:catechol 2,3-dioxygenase-like lactoylglutathione lyase family enzyme
MFKPVAAFSGFSVDNIDKAKEFYGQTLGLKIDDMMGGMRMELPEGHTVWAYAKPDHQPAVYTMLNFVVEDIDAAVDDLAKRGVQFERYDGFHQDDKGIARGRAAKQGPDIAWFKDPAGNILAVLQDD